MIVLEQIPRGVPGHDHAPRRDQRQLGNHRAVQAGHQCRARIVRAPDTHPGIIDERRLGHGDYFAVCRLQHARTLEVVPRFAQLDLRVFALCRGNRPDIVVSPKLKLGPLRCDMQRVAARPLIDNVAKSDTFVVSTRLKLKRRAVLPAVSHGGAPVTVVD